MKFSTYVSIFEKVAEQTNQILFIGHIEAKKLVYANPSFQKIWQRPIQPYLEEPELLLQTIQEEDREYLLESLEQILAGADKKDIEFKIVLPDQAIRWICLSPFFIEDTGNTYLAGFVQDITDQKAYNQNMLEFNAKKNSVLEILSHDLAGPMNTVKLLAALLAKKVKPYGNDEVINLTELIEDTCNRSVKLIRDFVTHEFLESSNVTMNKHRVNLTEKINQLLSQYRGSAHNIAKVFKLTCSSDKIYVEIDEMKFMQVINNLYSNAIKFTYDDGIIATHIQEESDHVLITISDNGIGIPKELQDGLFEKFTKARRLGIRGEESTGLGMSVIKIIVEMHKGTIWFESEENKGSTFYISLPKDES
jgi:two-component system sensor histidine kinase VicK